jgi:2-amino-4-hydroxy-6-hydroxymethyldihydropteridine diphosphokinase
MKIKTAFLSLGSNLDNPKQQILDALERLKSHPSLYEVVASKLYYSRPLGPQDQPDFINVCVRLQTSLSASLLLDVLQWLECKAQRKRVRHWGERSLDADLIYYQYDSDERTWQCARLILPHSQYTKRDFVLLPLREVLDDSWKIDIDALCAKLDNHFIANEH